MLPWEGEPFNTDSSVLKNFTILMELVQSVLKFFEGVLCYHIAANNVTKFQKCMECLHNVTRNVAFDGWQIDLQG